MACDNSSAEEVADKLHTVAYSEHRNTELENVHRAFGGILSVHAVGSAGENDPNRLESCDLLDIGVVREYDRIHAAFTDASGYQLLVLPAKVEDHNGLIVHIYCPFVTACVSRGKFSEYSLPPQGA